ncbi:MAG: hypothetical protein U5K69_08135 [Balneolaceae bacterium]|nr:hypothetical protein [Balneolaceae bacterium]
MEHIGLDGQKGHYFQKLAGALLYGEPSLRAPEETLKKNRKTQSGLWTHGISGDLPILLYSIRDTDHLKYVEQLLKAHALWRLKQFDVDLVFINDHPPSYADELHEAVHQSLQASMERQQFNKRGGIFILRGEDLSSEDRVLLETVAAGVLTGKLKKLDFSGNGYSSDESAKFSKPAELFVSAEQEKSKPAELQFYNGFGGFSQDGKEYVIELKADRSGTRLQYPPAPWINVIANESFGFISSEQGSDYTWSQNSRENQSHTMVE